MVLEVNVPVILNLITCYCDLPFVMVKFMVVILKYCLILVAVAHFNLPNQAGPFAVNLISEE